MSEPLSTPTVDPAATPWTRRREALWVLTLSLLAPLVVFRDVWLSRFTQIPGDTYDGRLNHFFIEHSWGWLIRRPVDSSLWGLPDFFPHGQNALAYSDPMVAFGPLYWPWRALGLPPDVSYALWMMAVVAVSVVAGYALLRVAVRLSPASAAVGAWFVACSASRIHQISHAQLLPTFYVSAGLAGAIGWARAESVRARRACAALAATALVAQLYGGFYQGLFLGMAVMAIALCALFVREARLEVLRRGRADWLVLLLIGALTALALLPWAAHYHAAQSAVGPRRWEEVVTMVPRPASWLYMTPRALFYRWTRHAYVFRTLPWDFEHAMGVGLFTTACVLMATWQAQRRLAVRLAMGAALLLIAATTMVHGHTLWRQVFDHVPGVGAARAISRIGLLLPFAAAVVLGTWADSLRGRARAAALALLVGCAVEQLATLDVHDREVQRHWVGEIARQVDRDAAAFVVTRSSDRGGAMLVHLDAMLAAQVTGVPTVNGSSGNDPPGWYGLQWARVRNELATQLFREALDAWLHSGGVDPSRVQWIRLSPKFRGAEALQRKPRHRPRAAHTPSR